MLDDVRISEIEEKINYCFSNKKLLEVALTHSSFSNEHGGESNEKLEFLGDSILNFLVAEKLYHEQIDDEGTMSVLRSELVSMKPLANAVKNMNLLQYLRIGKGLKKTELSLKIQSNIFESILAAIYLDGGLKDCRNFVFDNLEFNNILSNDYKTHLQEYVQAYMKGKVIEYKDSLFGSYYVSELYIDGKLFGTGKGIRKKDAQQEAAKIACNKLNIEINN